MWLVIHVIGQKINEQIMNEDDENVELCIFPYIQTIFVVFLIFLVTSNINVVWISAMLTIYRDYMNTVISAETNVLGQDVFLL